MSLDATRWAWAKRGLRPLAKFILLNLADRAGAEDVSYPSYDQIILDTGVDRKTIWESLKILESNGLIERNGKLGRTGSITIWKLIGVDHDKEIPKTEHLSRSKNGIPKTEAVPKLERVPFSEVVPISDLSSSENGMPSSSENGMPSSSENGIRNLPWEPTIGTYHRNLPWEPPPSPPGGLSRKRVTPPAKTSAAPKTPSPKSVWLTPADMPEVPADLATELLGFRRARRAPLTHRAWTGILAEIAKAGMSPEAGVGLMLANGWQGFRAEWAQNKGLARESRRNGRPALTDAEYDAAVARAMEHNFGIILPTNPSIIEGEFNASE